MGGLVIDIWVEFIFRAMVRMFRSLVAWSWPTITAEISSTKYRSGGIGCAVAELTYKYRFGGDLYAGTSAKPFLLDNTAKLYLADHSAGDPLFIRVNARRPETSVVNLDQ
jgi:hypothetical protein